MAIAGACGKYLENAFARLNTDVDCKYVDCCSDSTATVLRTFRFCTYSVMEYFVLTAGKN